MASPKKTAGKISSMVLAAFTTTVGLKKRLAGSPPSRSPAASSPVAGVGGPDLLGHLCEHCPGHGMGLLRCGLSLTARGQVRTGSAVWEWGPDKNSALAVFWLRGALRVPSPTPQVWCKAAASSACTVIRSCRSHCDRHVKQTGFTQRPTQPVWTSLL